MFQLASVLREMQRILEIKFEVESHLRKMGPYEVHFTCDSPCDCHFTL